MKCSSQEQATLSAGQPDIIGCERSVDVARPAHLGVVIDCSKIVDKIGDVSRDAINAGLVVAPPHLARLDVCR